MKILFITSNRVGDAVLSTGLLAWLIERYPQAQFTVACGTYAAGLFRAVPRLDRLIVLEKKSWNRHWLELWKECIGMRWDLVVDLRDSVASRLLLARKRARPSRGTGQHKVIENASVLNQLRDMIDEEGCANPLPLAGRVRVGGAKQGRSYEFRDQSMPDAPPSSLPVTRERVTGGGTWPALASPPSPHIWLDEKAEQEATRLLPAARPLFALGPAANWPCKQWPIERFAALAQKLTADSGPLPSASMLIIADAHERQQIVPLIESIPAGKCVEIIGRDLLTVAACLKHCRLFVGNDSGLMHVAAAMGTPTLGLFGPGYEEIYGPWGAHGAVIRTPESRETLLARLPNLSAREPNLMEGLSVKDVYTAVKKLLKH